MVQFGNFGSMEIESFLEFISVSKIIQFSIQFSTASCFNFAFSENSVNFVPQKYAGSAVG